MHSSSASSGATSQATSQSPSLGLSAEQSPGQSLSAPSPGSSSKPVRIGLLSDTHGFWDPKFALYLEQCDEVWHAGDIGSPQLVARFLSLGKTFRAVYGNADPQVLRLSYPLNQSFCCGGARVLMTHIASYHGSLTRRVQNLLLEQRPQILVSGHSHILKVGYDKHMGVLCVNPGAAGNFGIHTVRTLLRFSLCCGSPSDMEVVELGPNI